MTKITEIQRFNDENAASLLKTIADNMNSDTDELVLDFSGVRRLDANALRALEQFASTADARSIKVALRGASAEIYKVLTLVKLTSRFAFVS